MRGWTKTLMWVGILLACAGVGAGVAYLFPPNPFPPGVRDTGPVPSESPSPSPSEPELVRWQLTMSSRTTHTYRVGGSCTSDWRARGQIRLTESGRVQGRAIARLLPGAKCDFPSAQIQARRVVFFIFGRRDAGELDLRFREGDRRPVGSQDLGGFLETLTTIRFSIPERAGAEASKPKRIEDPPDEIYASFTRIQLRRE
ncbi:MAG TPA: hypothetical protein VMR89_02545 [Actinomycetota bacterium]|nr:hypothetical protein [Actinomycetota bacterium]